MQRIPYERPRRPSTHPMTSSARTSGELRPVVDLEVIRGAKLSTSARIRSAAPTLAYWKAIA